MSSITREHGVQVPPRRYEIRYLDGCVERVDLHGPSTWRHANMTTPDAGELDTDRVTLNALLCALRDGASVHFPEAPNG